MHINNLIKQFENKTGMRELAFSEEGVITFLLEGRYTTHFEKSEDEQHLTVYAEIGVLPHDNREECMMRLLEANLFGIKTGGATIGIDPDTEEVFLSKTFDMYQLQFERFYEQLSAFLKTQRRWTDYMKNQGFITNRAL